MTVSERLISIFENVFDGEIDISNITDHSRLIEDVGMNSIGMLYMAMAIEEEFDIKFNNEDFLMLSTVEDVKKLIEAKTKA